MSRLAGGLAGLAGLAGGRPGWRADSGEGSRMQHIHDEKHTFSDLDKNYSGIGKLVA